MDHKHKVKAIADMLWKMIEDPSWKPTPKQLVEAAHELDEIHCLCWNKYFTLI